ncbi:hypothetical protein ACFXJ5_30700 [Streptomyces sp. NPDC059373]
MADASYRAARAAARTEVPLLAAGNTTTRQAANQLANRLAADHQLEYGGFALGLSRGEGSSGWCVR